MTTASRDRHLKKPGTTCDNPSLRFCCHWWFWCSCRQKNDNPFYNLFLMGVCTVCRDQIHINNVVVDYRRSFFCHILWKQHHHSVTIFMQLWHFLQSILISTEWYLCSHALSEEFLRQRSGKFCTVFRSPWGHVLHASG